MKYKHPFHSAVIVAAGSGSRMGTCQTKQTMELAGIPVVIHTILAFQNCRDIDEIIIVVKDGEESFYPPYLKQYQLNKVKHIVKGGATRQDSVMAGLKAVNEDSKFLSIHDGARCLITPEQISDVAKVAYKNRCAIAASPVKDTVKTVKSNHTIENTPNRSLLWNAGTPQTFQTELYRACAYTAKQRNITGTDDSSLAEQLGFAVSVVDIGYENLKITTPEDLLFAQVILKKREKQDNKV